jgi:hypothetical protein
MVSPGFESPNIMLYAIFIAVSNANFAEKIGPQ